MGHVHVDAEIVGNEARRTVRFLVDTGATWSLLPERLATELGVPLLVEPMRVSLANNEVCLARVGVVQIRLAGREAAMTTLVLPDGEPLLGVEALEGLGLKVDPTTHALEPTRPRAGLLVGVRRTT